MAKNRLKNIVASGLAALCLAFSPAKADEPVKEAAPEAAAEVQTSKPESVFSAETSFSIGASQYSANGRKFSEGISGHAALSVEAKPLEWLAIGASTDFSAETMSALKDGSDHMLMNGFTSLDVRFKASDRDNHKVWLGLSGEYMFDKKTRQIKDIEAFTRLDLAGPKGTLLWQNDYVDVAFEIGGLFGKKETSYDPSYGLMGGHAKLALVPHLWRFSLPASAELVYWRLAGQKTDRHNFVIRVAAEPGFRVTGPLIIHARLVYETMPIGEDNYTMFEAGAGLKLKW